MEENKVRLPFRCSQTNPDGKPCRLFKRKRSQIKIVMESIGPARERTFNEAIPWITGSGATYVSTMSGDDIEKDLKKMGPNDPEREPIRRLLEKTRKLERSRVRKMTHEEHKTTEQRDVAKKYWEGLRARTSVEREIEVFVAEETRKAREEGEAFAAKKILEIGEDADKLRAHEAERERLKRLRAKPKKLVVKL